MPLTLVYGLVAAFIVIAIYFTRGRAVAAAALAATIVGYVALVALVTSRMP